MLTYSASSSRRWISKIWRNSCCTCNSEVGDSSSINLEKKLFFFCILDLTKRKKKISCGRKVPANKNRRVHREAAKLKKKKSNNELRNASCSKPYFDPIKLQYFF
jgi:hypothetical protein